MPFGKYQGYDLADIPTSYLRWLVEHVDLYGELADEVEAELAARACAQRQVSAAGGLAIQVAPEDVPLVREIIERGYKAAVRVHHPDAGGNAEIMKRLNILADSLRSQLADVEVI